MRTLSLSWVLAAFLLLVNGRVVQAGEPEVPPGRTMEQAAQPAACQQTGGGSQVQEESSSGVASTEDSVENPLGQYYLWHRYGVADLRAAEKDGPT